MSRQRFVNGAAEKEGGQEVTVTVDGVLVIDTVLVFCLKRGFVNRCVSDNDRSPRWLILLLLMDRITAEALMFVNGHLLQACCQNVISCYYKNINFLMASCLCWVSFMLIMNR